MKTSLVNEQLRKITQVTKDYLCSINTKILTFPSHFHSVVRDSVISLSTMLHPQLFASKDIPLILLLHI